MSRRHNELFLARLKDAPCTDCSQRFLSEAMDFDHVRGTKRGNVSDLLHLPRPQLLEEIGKCELVCANCHRRRTRDRHSEAHLDEAETADMLAAMLTT